MIAAVASGASSILYKCYGDFLPHTNRYIETQENQYTKFLEALMVIKSKIVVQLQNRYAVRMAEQTIQETSDQYNDLPPPATIINVLNLFNQISDMLQTSGQGLSSGWFNWDVVLRDQYERLEDTDFQDLQHVDIDTLIYESVGAFSIALLEAAQAGGYPDFDNQEGAATAQRLPIILDQMYGGQDGAWRDILLGNIEFDDTQIPNVLGEMVGPEAPTIAQEDIEANAQRIRDQLAAAAASPDQDAEAVALDNLERIDELCGICAANPIDINMEHEGPGGRQILHHYLCESCFNQLIPVDQCPLDREEVVHIHPTNTPELKLKLFSQVGDLLLEQANVPISSFLQIAQQISEIRNESELAQIRSFPVNDQEQMNEMVRSMYNLYVRLQQEQEQNVVAGIGQNRTPLDELKFIIQAAKEKHDEKQIGSRFESKRGAKRGVKRQRRQRRQRQRRQHEKKMRALNFLKKVMSKTMKRYNKKICQINDPNLIVKTAKKKLMNVHKKCKSRRKSRRRSPDRKSRQ